MKKKLPLVLSFALAALIVIGQASFAKGGTDVSSGMENMMNGNGMTNMMEHANMNKMMSTMNSPAGKQMINDCQNFMTQFDDDK